MASAASTPPLVTLREAARLLGVSRSTVYRLVYAGDLPAFRIGSRVQVGTQALLAYVNARDVLTTPKRRSAARLAPARTQLT
jgi:excisionase family DNA binding protein